ncbi:MAG: hypothetical protein FJZ92_04585 [Chloroflexi bacterium]|nr:hypothetical protein [Chloroflexota bacterium]
MLSLVPLSAPLAMPARYAGGEPPLWELALAVGLMLLAIADSVWLAARVYSGAILAGAPRIRVLDALRSSREIR